MAEQIEKILIPDIGGATGVSVIEIMVKSGDQVNEEDSLVTLESDKATMEVPSPLNGKVKDIALEIGDKVSEGDLILTMELSNGAASHAFIPTAESKSELTSKSTPEQGSQKEGSKAESSPAQTSQEKSSKAESVEVTVPDIGGATGVDVIEVAINPGDKIAAEDTLVTLEGDKASMDVPSPFAGTVTNVHMQVGDKVNEGDLICIIETGDGESVAPKQELKSETQSKQTQPDQSAQSKSTTEKTTESEPQQSGEVHAGPAVRRVANAVGVDLAKLKGTGPKSRITKADVKEYVQSFMQGKSTPSADTGLSLPSVPAVDFTKFGEIETQSLSKIKKLAGGFLHRNWVSIPHVTQFGEADITQMEAFRQEQKARAAQEGVKLTPLAFIMKAVVAALREFPHFNASLSPDGSELILKKYFHIGVAVDTPDGLVVPVVRNVEQKGLFDLAKELADVSEKAREEGLGLADMQGGCFSISSLGGIGGTAFTPIINAPEVAILGVSKSSYKPEYQMDGTFVPRLMLPLSLSYDHRVIDGADGARFMMYLASCLADIRTLLL